jgi:hypothetical protein
MPSMQKRAAPPIDETTNGGADMSFSTSCAPVPRSSVAEVP